MEVGIITLLNLIAGNVPIDRFRYKSHQVLDNEASKLADLRQATKLLKRWAT